MTEKNDQPSERYFEQNSALRFANAVTDDVLHVRPEPREEVFARVAYLMQLVHQHAAYEEHELGEGQIGLYLPMRTRMVAEFAWHAEYLPALRAHLGTLAAPEEREALATMLERARRHLQSTPPSSEG